MTAKNTAVFFRSLALFAVLYQLRLLAADLVDTQVFIITLLASFAAAVFISTYRRKGKAAGPIAALATISLVPWAVRFFIAAPRFFIPGSTGPTAIALDSLLLNFDRNGFVTLLPFYWIAASTCLSTRNRKFLRAAVIADASILIVIYSIAHVSDIELYRWPVVMIAVFAGIVFLQILSLIFSLPPQTRLGTWEKRIAIAAFFVLIVLGGFLFLKPIQEQAVTRGGGLLEPKLFSFDFSQFLRLDPEISMNDDLVLIVKKDTNDNNILLRRSVLSGYNGRQGFYRADILDERNHPQRLPNRQTVLPQQNFKAAKTIVQEYFLVNFESSAFIGMKEPVIISPYESWDSSSFKSAYMVESLASSASFYDLSRSTVTTGGDRWPLAADLGLGENEFLTYTEFGNDQRIRAFAEEITKGANRYSDKVLMIYNRLKFGEYRYSLKPGIAPDGDQLAFFLFQTKKGYCSYYAFAMTLLLRSLGIPARVAAGFFIDPETGIFDYYPVRSDMAHTWVEVAFPGYGWIEFDPTTERLAEGEEFAFSSGTDPSLLERLMREILENRSKLKLKEGADEESADRFSSFAHNAAELLRNYGLWILLAALAILFLYMRYGLYLLALAAHKARKKSVRLFAHAQRRLSLAGINRPRDVTLPEWTCGLNLQIEGIYPMYEGAAAARFAPDYSINDYEMQNANYKTFSKNYCEKVPVRRRILAWVFPPLALILNRGKRGWHIVAIFLFLLIPSGSKTAAQDNLSADDLYNNALLSEYTEFWERAIELYREGETRFPDDERFSWSLGNLYYSRGLFGLAWDEYKKTEKLVPYSPFVLTRLARTAGYLNEDHISVDYYERALLIDPENRDAIGSLGWMYYKVHRLADAENLLLRALENFGDSADFSMTLGTVYSDMYMYNDGKYWYNKAIALGESTEDRVFTSVAYYNLSILESNFYRYALAMEAVNSSLRAQTRSSGRLASGELYMRRLELETAQSEYQAAYETDTSPLSKLNLAQIYQISGRLEEARLYALDCLRGSDNSWMLNFGIDPDRYRMDIHEILYKTYYGLMKAERLTPWGRPGEKIKSLLRSISYNFRYAVHIRLYHKYSLAAADAYGGQVFEGGPHLDSVVKYYDAFESYPRRALAYLNAAGAFKISLIPASAPSYDLDRGVLLADMESLQSAISGFDPFWEKDLLAEGYREIAAIQGSRRLGRQAAEELFVCNRGALPQAGISLPVEMRVSFSEDAPNHARAERTIRKTLSKAGFDNRDQARFVLNVYIVPGQNYTAICELIDSEGQASLRYSLLLKSLKKTDICDFARALKGKVFVVGG